MRAELRSLDSVEAPDELESFQPDDPEAFSIAVGASIGPADGTGAELSYFNVCSPRWVEENPPPKGSSSCMATSSSAGGTTTSCAVP